MHKGIRLLSTITCLLLLLSLTACQEGQPQESSSVDVTQNVNISQEEKSDHPVAEGNSESQKPQEETQEGAPVVYFTSDISAEGLVKIYEKLGWEPTVTLEEGLKRTIEYFRTKY